MGAAKACSLEMDKQVKLMSEQIQDLKAQRDYLQASSATKKEEARAAKEAKRKAGRQSRSKKKAFDDTASET